MNIADVSNLVLELARNESISCESSVLLWVLGSNLREYTPARKDFYRALTAPERTQRDVLLSLTGDNNVLLQEGGRFALAPFAGLFRTGGEMPYPLRGGNPPSTGERPPEVGRNSPEVGKNSPEVGGVSPRSRAVVDSEALARSSSSAVLNCLSDLPSSIDATVLLTFAQLKCKLTTADDDAGVLAFIQKHGLPLTCLLLEQYYHNFVRRGKEARNPIGMLHHWYANPDKIDDLSKIKHLTVTEWWLRASLPLSMPVATNRRVPRPPARHIGPNQLALIQAQQLYAVAKGPMPTQQMREDARQERESAKAKQPLPNPPAAEA